METQSWFDQVKQTVRKSITIKLLMIGLLVLILLIPTEMVEQTIHQRARTRQGAVAEVSSSWGSSQTILGPFLTISYKVYSKDDKGKIIENVYRAHFLPDDLEFDGSITTETRHRGIFDVVLYNAVVNVTGAFSAPDFEIWKIRPQDILVEDAYLSVGITDMKGIKEGLTLRWGELLLPFNPGIGDQDLTSSGVSVRVPLEIKKSGKSSSYPFSFDLNLNGSEQLLFVPLGKETRASIQSPWSDPSFIGSFLPQPGSDISSEGFKARWKVLQLNRNYPQQWTESCYSTRDSAFGVRLLIPADQYQQTLRSAKYAFLFIILTLLALLFIERWRSVFLHPVQYLLAGFALIVFYLLLLSFSEHMAFNAAYAIAGLAVVILLTAFTRGILGQNRLALSLGGIVAILYGYLFVLLKLTDYALLIGSLGIFVVLGILMYVARRINRESSG